MSKPSITDHERQFDGWPTLPTAGGAYMPERDGDIALLEELSERVFDVLRDAFASRQPFSVDDIGGAGVDVFYQIMRRDAGLPGLGLRYWPDDRAAEQIAIWRAQLDGIA